MAFITEFFTNILRFLVETTSGNLGLAILLFTFLIRSALIPLTLPSLRASQKMKEVQPQIKNLQKKHGKDKAAFQKAQLELYKKYNINPLSGCLPQLAQLAVLIILYRVLISFLTNPSVSGVDVKLSFLWIADLGKVPEISLSHISNFILPLLAMATQMVLSLMIAPGAEIRDVVPNTSKSKAIQEENKKEDNMADMAQSMQQQMMYIMPIMTGFIALKFPAGLALYWVATTLFSIGQQWYVSGPGGIAIYYTRLVNRIKNS